MAFPDLNREYALQNKATGFYLMGRWLPEPEAAHTVFAAGDPESYWASKRWVLRESADQGLYQLVSSGGDGSGLVLDSNAERQVYILGNNGESYQKWRMIDGGEGYWCLHNLATGYALDSNADRDVYTHDPNDGAYRRWKFIAV